MLKFQAKNLNPIPFFDGAKKQPKNSPQIAELTEL